MNNERHIITPMFIEEPNAPSSLNIPGIHLRVVPLERPCIIGPTDMIKKKKNINFNIVISTLSDVTMFEPRTKIATNRKVKKIPRT
jgi:hypothetical protein